MRDLLHFIKTSKNIAVKQPWL